MKPFQEQTYYELLEVQTQASMDEIRRAYERASELYSPDSVAMYALEDPSLATDLRARLREAMEILTDEDLREEYDRMIGIAPRHAPAEILRREQEREEGTDEELPAQLAMAEVIASAETVNSTHRELRVSYVERAEAAAPARALEDTQPNPRPSLPEAQPANELRASARPQTRLDAAPEMAAEAAIADAESAMAQVAAKVKEVAATPKPKPLEIPPDAEFNGELLRRAREARGLTVGQMADRTRIGSRHLENIEADRHAELPANVYLRGMLMSLAKELGLDGNRVAKSYLAQAKR